LFEDVVQEYCEAHIQPTLLFLSWVGFFVSSILTTFKVVTCEKVVKKREKILHPYKRKKDAQSQPNPA